MILTVMERLQLLQILPKEGDFLTLKVLRQLKDAISFGEDDHKLYKFEVKDGMARWDNSVPQEKEIVIGEKATDLVMDALKGLNDKKKLTEAHMSLYEKFIGD